MTSDDRRTFAVTVAMLKQLTIAQRHMALFCAECWSDEQLLAAEARGGLPGQSVLPPKPAHLKLVPTENSHA